VPAPRSASIASVGTMVTVTSVLSAALGAHVLTWAAVALFGLLLANWLNVASRIARGIWSGSSRNRPAPPVTATIS
jgi:hypothetical protein